MRILIIEDEFNLADVISSRLKKENYIIDNSYDGETGLENGDNQAKSITLKLDSSSKIKLTGDSYVTSLDSDYNNIDFNGYTLYVNGVAIN